MKHTAFSLTLAFTFIAALQSTPAQALNARSFVSASGSDANDCTRPTPCRSFQAAHDQTNSGGDIVVLDAAGYGPVTITKSISIINDGVGEASMLVAGGVNGIEITAGPGDVVRLRGLTLYGIGANAGNGIVFNIGKSLIIENCAIHKMTGTGTLGSGILFRPSSSGNLEVQNTIVSDSGLHGVVVQPTGSGTVTATLDRVQSLNSGFRGFNVNGGSSTATINAVITDSIAAKNAVSGFTAVANANQATDVMVIRSVAAHNGTDGGVTVANPNATLRVGQSSITGNAATFFVVSGGKLRSYGDNNIDGNLDGDPAIPTIIIKK